MSNVFFLKESFNKIKVEAKKLFEKHYLEIAHFQDIELNIDEESYLAMEKARAIRVFTARDEDYTLLGYAIFIMRYNLHYKDSYQAVQDVIYIDKDKRGFGLDFIDWCDEQLKSEGVQVIYHHVKEKHNFGPSLEKLGYELVDLIYARKVD